MGCGASQPGSPEPQEEHQPLLRDRRPGGGGGDQQQQWRAEQARQRSPSTSLPRGGGDSDLRGEKKTGVSPRATHSTGNGADLTTEQMALAIAVAALNRERASGGGGGGGEAEERRARALAAAMVAWAEGQAAQLTTADDGREVGRPPRHNFCFKCGAALHSAATFCADCGVKLPREGDTESWREREARLKRERDEKDRKEEEDRKRRAVSEFNSAGSNSSPAKLGGGGGGGDSARPKPKLNKNMSGLSLLGETEAQFRKRQNLERQESQQSLYGLDAELKEKEQEKLSMAEYRKMVDDAMTWLEQILGDKGIGDFPDNLKSGRVLCALINKHWPGMIPQVGDRPIPMIERENIRFYLAACEKVGVRKQDLFVISDLYDEKYLTGVILNLYALAPIIQRQSTFTGPTLVRYA